MNTMTDQRVQLRDPRTAYETPPFTSQDSFTPPGKTDQLTPRADHGESTYQGSGKLRGMNALITGGDSGINTVSIQGYTPAGRLLHYATSKSALIGMTKGMADLAIKQGVRVNAVAPGPVWTPLIPSTLAVEKFQHFGENTVFGRPAQPIELAPLYVWLASPEASFVTGEVYGATGGRSPV